MGRMSNRTEEVWLEGFLRKLAAEAAAVSVRATIVTGSCEHSTCQRQNTTEKKRDGNKTHRHISTNCSQLETRHMERKKKFKKTCITSKTNLTFAANWTYIVSSCPHKPQNTHTCSWPDCWGWKWFIFYF